jgi:hypothetical protein
MKAATGGTTMTIDDFSTAPAPAPRAPRSKAPAIVGASAVAAVALGVGGWFAFLSPHDSTVKLTADTSAAVPGKPVTLSGAVTPAVANRVVELAVATSASGPFTVTGTTVTDSAGRFQTTWAPAAAGPAWVRATAVELGRDQSAQSSTTGMTVRAPATLTLKLSAPTTRTTAPATVTATLGPAGGTITLEKSADGETWTPVTAKPGKNGTATAKLTGLAGGTWHVRAKAAQTDTASEAVSKDATLLVEDYKAAGARYLAIVAPGNKEVDKLNSLIDANASLAALKKEAAALSKAYTHQATNFRAYKGWPREVAPVIADLAKQCVLDADDFHMRSQARSFQEWNDQASSTETSTAAGASAAARARDLLGLPKRNLHP